MRKPSVRFVLPAALLSVALAGPGGSPSRAAGTVPKEDPAEGFDSHAYRRTGFRYQVGYGNIPKKSKAFDVWVPLPARDDVQKISDLVIQAPAGATATEPKFGNNIFHAASGPRGGTPFNVNIQLVVERREVRFPDFESKPSVPPEAPSNLGIYIEPAKLMPLDAEIHALAGKIVGKRRTIPEQARAIYDWVVENVKLEQTGTGRGQGDLKRVLSARSGDSLDVSTAFVGLARAVKIPARSVMGFKLPDGREQGYLTSYHAWAEFWLPDFGWIPVDPAMAILKPPQKGYYFGSLDQHRIAMSVGRDVTLTPSQQADPINYLFYPYAEVDGQPLGGSGYRFSFSPAPEPPAAASTP